MKRVLMVAYFFPPLSNSGTQRPLKFSKYLPEFGWEPIVLTVDRPPDIHRDPDLLKEIRPGTTIVRAPMLSDIIGDRIAAVFPRRLRRRVSEGLAWRLRRQFQVPDLYALWRPTARRAALRVFREVGFDAVWATGFPWTSLLIGRDIARMTRRPFIADFRDPWTGEDLFSSGADGLKSAVGRRVSVQRRLEESVLSQADAVVMLEDLVTDGLLQMPRDVRSREVVLIPNGYDQADLNAAAPFAPPRAGVARIVFTGAWKQGYGLDRLYEALRRLLESDPSIRDRIEVVAAGFDPGPAARAGVDGVVRELGRVPHSVALGIMKTADALFLPSAEGRRLKYHFPGKLYEYVATRRPVLATGATDGSMAALLRETGGAIVIDYQDQQKLTDVVRELARLRSIGQSPIDGQALMKYERRTLAGRLAQLLERVTDSSRS